MSVRNILFRSETGQDMAIGSSHFGFSMALSSCTAQEDHPSEETKLIAWGPECNVSDALIETGSLNLIWQSQLGHLTPRLDSDVYVLHDNDTSIVITEVYSVKRSSLMFYNKIGHWNGSGLAVIDTRTKHARRSDLGGITLDVAFGEYFPWSFYDESTEMYRGIDISILRTLSEKLNFKCNYIHNSDNTFT